MYMEQTMGNPELAFLFEEESNLKKSSSFIEMSKLYDAYEPKSAEEGEVVSSTYRGKMGDQHLFSVVGFKDDIRIEDKMSEDKYLKNSNVGDVIDVLILKIDEDNYFITGSIAAIYESRAHKNLMALAQGQSVTALIKSLNPAGYDIELSHGGVTLPAFMPNTLAGINKLHDQTSIVGKTLEVMIESYSGDEGTYIVSRRRYLQGLIPSAIKELQNGEVYNGHVTGTTPFGVFVEFNECLTGMIHKANVDPEWQDKLTTIKPGFEIQFYIKEVIKDKIILTQILRETLWDNIKNGQVLDGVVRDTKQFGTLINLDSETVGLIHTSEMEKLGKKFTSGQQLKVKVLSVDRMSRKIFLTLG